MNKLSFRALPDTPPLHRAPLYPLPAWEPDRDRTPRMPWPSAALLILAMSICGWVIFVQGVRVWL
jgi:hypothetical protein